MPTGTAGGRLALVAMLLSAVLLSACSSGSGDGGDRADSSSPTAESTTTTDSTEPDGPTTTQTLTPTTPEEVAPPPTTTAPTEITYTFPVDPSSVADYSPTHHDYPATDIFVPIGSRYVAVTDGVVDYVSTEDPWDPDTDDPATRGGISVAFIGVDGVRYYGSHLSEIAEGIAPGTRVTKGQLLGLTGTSGNAAGTTPHVHFGISRPTTPDDWRVRRGQLDPYPLLNAWRAGLLTAPDLSSL